MLRKPPKRPRTAPPAKSPKAEQMAYAALAAEVLAQLDAELATQMGGQVARTDADGGGSGPPVLQPGARADILRAMRGLLARLTSPKVLRGPLDKIAGRVLVWTSNQVTAQAKAAAGIDIRGVMGVDLTADDPALAAQVTAFRAEGVRAIRALGARKIGRVSAILADAGVSTRVEEIAARIRDEAGTSKAHANLLARDQVLKLNASVTQTRHQALGVTEYLWRTSRDERVRARHKELEGTRQAYAAPPVVDLRTGRRAHPGGDFQCRCTAEPVIPGFDDGAEAPR